MNWRKEVDAFKSSMSPVAPKISAQAIRFGFFGTVGGGKSTTAGIFAVGINPKGKYGWIDGEGQRSPWAIDSVAEMAAKKYGGTKAEWVARFQIIHIDPPFNPLRIVAAIEMLEDSGCNVIILDVLTQCWSGDGSYLDMRDDKIDAMAGEDESKRKRVAAAAAANVKPWTHQKLVNKIDASKASLVLLFQAKRKWNAQASRPDEFVTPIQESGLTRTAIAVGRVEEKIQDGQAVGGFTTFSAAIGEGCKFTHPNILKCLPNGQQFTFEHAEAVARLCAGESTPKPATSQMAALKRELVALTKSFHGGDMAALEQHLIDEVLMDPADTLASLTETHLSAIVNKLKKKQLSPTINVPDLKALQ